MVTNLIVPAPRVGMILFSFDSCETEAQSCNLASVMLLVSGRGELEPISVDQPTFISMDSFFQQKAMLGGFWVSSHCGGEGVVFMC